MKNLELYFENPFASVHISFDRLKNATHDHLQRLIAQNANGMFDAEITALTTAYENYFSELTDAGSSGSLRQARTLAVDQHLATFTKRVQQLHAFLISQDLKETPVFLEFFPEGGSKFIRNIKKENAAQQMQELIKAISANSAVAGGPAVLTQFQELLTTYNTLRGQQLGKKGEEDSKKNSRDAARKALVNQLFMNLLMISRKFPGQPEKVKDFFDEVAFTGTQSNAAGKARIRFTVKDSKNKPVEGVVLKVQNADISEAVTNYDGRALSQFLPAGTYTIHTTAEGFPATTVIVNASKGKTEDAFIVL